MHITSKVDPRITIEHLEFDTPESFIVSRDGMSYTVLPYGVGVTLGDIEAVASCPAPTPGTNGSTVRLSRVHDEFTGLHDGANAASKWVTRLQARAADGKFCRYHHLETYGTTGPITPVNEADPEFLGVFEDVTAEFLRSAAETQMQARIDMGRIYQKLCVDADPARPWAGHTIPGIVFVGTFAPDLDGLSARELRGLLAEAGFEDGAAFGRTCFLPHPQTREAAAALLSGITVPLGHPDEENLDYYRLHSDERVQDESYRDMISVASAELARLTPPDLSMPLNVTSSMAMAI